MDCRARTMLVKKFILCETPTPYFCMFYSRCLRGVRMVGPGSRCRGARQIGNLHKPVGAKRLRAVGILGVPSAETRGATSPQSRLRWKQARKSGFGRTEGKFLKSPLRISGTYKKILHSKQRLGRTHKSNSESNAKVYDLNQKTMKALDTLATLKQESWRGGLVV